MQSRRDRRGQRQPAAATLLAIIALLAVPVAAGLFAVPARTAVISSACRVTGCSGGGMVTAGWLLPVLPAAVLITALLTWPRVGRPSRIGLFLVAGLAAATALVFVPRRGESFSLIMRGAGADQMATGLRWGLLGLVAAVILAFAARSLAGRLRRPARNLGVTVAVVAVVAALGIAWIRAAPTYLTAADVFAEAGFTTAGATLTRVSSADRRGCAGVFADDSLLSRAPCVRTLHATFTTDDSDALVNFRAVLYLSGADARAVRDALPAGVVPADAHGSVRSVHSISDTWLLVGAVGHDDGRPIRTGDRGWLLWALKCVTYRFLGVQSGFRVEPTPADGIRPRNS